MLDLSEVDTSLPRDEQLLLPKAPHDALTFEELAQRYNYLDTSDRRLVFGLGKTTRIDKLSVFWPDGRRQQWTGLGLDRYHVLVQGEKTARSSRLKK